MWQYVARTAWFPIFAKAPTVQPQAVFSKYGLLKKLQSPSTKTLSTMYFASLSSNVFGLATEPPLSHRSEA